jgi:hypothetical protein
VGQENGSKSDFQIPIYPRVPGSREVGEQFGLLFGSGTRELAELWRTKSECPGLSLWFRFIDFFWIFPSQIEHQLRQNANWRFLGEVLLVVYT